MTSHHIDDTTVPTVLVFVPGTTASELIGTIPLTEKPLPLWPELLDPVRLGLNLPTALTEFETSTTLTIGDIVLSYQLSNATLPCYGSLLNYLQTPANFTDGTAFTAFSYSTVNENQPIPAQDRLFFTVPYDWRQSNTVSGQRLATALNALHLAYKAKYTNYNLYLVGHSMGGLVSRFALEGLGNASGQNPWIPYTQALVTLATPHSGAPLALAAIIGQKVFHEETDAVAEFIKITVNRPLFPSTYELLPQPGRQFITDQGTAYDLDNLPADVEKTLQSSGYHPETWSGDAETFFQQLNPAKTTVPYQIFYGKQTLDVAETPTVTGFNYAGNAFVPFTGDGDTIVPVGSADFSAWTYQYATTQAFPGYTHGYMGGSNMDAHPDAIVALLKLANIPVAATAEAEEAQPA